MSSEVSGTEVAAQSPDPPVRPVAAKTTGRHDTAEPTSATTIGVVAAPATHKHPTWLTLLEKYGLVILFGATVVFFTLYSGSSEYFLTGANIRNVLSNQTTIILVAVASMIPLVCGRFDFSVGSTAGLCSMAAAALMSDFHQNLAVASVVSVGIGLLVGAINGALVAYLKLSSVIVTLAAITLISGVVLAYAKGQIISSNISQTLTDFGSEDWLGIPQVVVMTAVICVLAWFTLEHTAYGRYIAMTGRNEEAARLVGMNVDAMIFTSFVISGGMGGFVGLLMTALSGSANPTSGPDLLFPALTAVFLGATAIRPGEFNVLGVVVAALFLAAAVSGMNISGVPAYIQPLFNGTALLVASAIYVFSRRSSGAGVLSI